jgi:hypothetical protein
VTPGATLAADEDHDGESVAIPIGGFVAAPDDTSEVAKALAAETVRRYGNQHGCRQGSTNTPCIHPNHRRDVDYTHHLLSMLGLPHTYPVDL